MIEEIKKLISEGKSYSSISSIIGIHRTTISKICKENNIIKPQKKINTHCVVCGKNLGNNKKNYSKCKTCVTRLRRLRIKIKAVEYLGGKCINCGFNKHIAALEFHHLDKEGKEFNISRSSHSVSWDKLKLELDKCVILCSNCHHIEHSKYDKDNLKDFL